MISVAKYRVADREAAQRAKNVKQANKQGPIKKKASLYIYVLVLVLAMFARALQLYTNFDFDTHRYIDSFPLTNYPLLVMIPGFILIAFVLITGSARDKVIKSVVLINPWRLRYDRVGKKIPSSAGYSSLIMAATILADIVFWFVELVEGNKRIRSTLEGYDYKEYNLLTGYTVGDFFYHFLSLLTILVFIFIAVNIFKGEGFSHANCASLYIYALWQIVNIFRMNANGEIIGMLTDRRYELISRMLTVLFFCAVARFFNGMEKKNTRFWMCFLGYTASIVSAVSTLPRYFLIALPDGYDSRMNMLMPTPSDVGMIFMPITIVVVFWSTYVYRVMPRLSEGNRRWTRAPLSRNYEEMAVLDESPAEGVELPDSDTLRK